MKTPKSMKGLKQAHTSNDKMGSGDYYGTGVKQKVGKVIESSMNFKDLPKKTLKKPPRSLA